MGMITEENAHAVFSHHQPDPDAQKRIQEVRDGAEAFARVILRNSPGCADQSAALRHVRDAMMTTNAAIVLGGLL